jgi:dynein heavy chain
VAFRASLLYFCILDLSLIDPMYQYSLQWFSNLFVLGVENSAPSNALEERLENMKEYFTYSLYENICRSLFEKHKLMFSFLLTVKILFGDGVMNEKEWRFFLAGPTGDIPIPSNPTTWINENVWPEVYRQIKAMSETFSSFRGLDLDFLKRCDSYKPFYDSQTPQEEKLPAPYDGVPNFDKLSFLKALRSDKLIEGVQNWIVEKMDKKYIIVPTFNLGNCFKDSTITTPLIFVLSAGSDPIADFMKFAE